MWWMRAGVVVVTTVLWGRALWVLVRLVTARGLLLSAAAQPGTVRPHGVPPRLLILLPMLREQTVVAGALRTFRALDYPDGQAAVCVITTEREERQKAERRQRLAGLTAGGLTEDDLSGLFPRARMGEVIEEVGRCKADGADGADEAEATLLRLYDATPTTAQLVEAILAEPADGEQGVRPLPVVHLHQPDVPGRKGSQLNHAVRQLPAIAAQLGWTDVDDDHTYVVVYDADASPDPRTLGAIAQVVGRYRAEGRQPPGLIQQQRLPISLGRRFPRSLVGGLLAADWLYQLRRCLAIELARVRRHERVESGRLPAFARAVLRPFVYAVGCGMIVRVSALRQVGGFQAPLSDIGTGFRITLSGEPIASLPLFAVDEPYTDLRSLVNLLTLSYVSRRRPERHARAVRASSRLPPADRILLVFREYRDLFLRVWSAPISVLALVCAVLVGGPWPLVLLGGIVVWGPVTALTILGMIPSMWDATGDQTAARRPRQAIRAVPWQLRCGALLLSPLAEFIEMAGPLRVVLRRDGAGHHDKTER